MQKIQRIFHIRLGICVCLAFDEYTHYQTFKHTAVEIHEPKAKI